MESRRFPQELVDYTIDYLHDNIPALISCSLVCQAWVASTRLHIFSQQILLPPSIRSNLGARSPHKPCQRLHQLLTESPHITHFIRDLHVHEGFLASSWMAGDETLPILLRKLTHLRRLEFHGALTVHWDRLPLNLRSAIRAIFSSAPLTSVRFDSWSFAKVADFGSLLGDCPTLKHLALAFFRAGSQDSDTSLEVAPARALAGQHARRAQLDSLTLNYVNSAFLRDWLLSPRSTVDVTNLRELRVSHSNDTEDIESLLGIVEHSLEHLHLKLGPSHGHTLDIGHSPRLRSVRLTLDRSSSAVAYMMAFFASIRKPNCIERVTIEFDVDLTNFSGWEDLDSVLSRPELYSLHHVDVGVVADNSTSEFQKAERELCMLGARGILRVYQLGSKSWLLYGDPNLLPPT